MLIFSNLPMGPTVKAIRLFAGLALFLATNAFAQNVGHDKNFSNCNNGYMGCNPSLLTDSQRAQVEQSGLQRNFNNCNNGYMGCTPSLLNETQRGQVERSALQRNFNNCKNGYMGCTPSLLTDVQRTQVEQSALQRNYNNCNNGYMGCNPSRLSDTQQAQVQKSAIDRNVRNCKNGYMGCNLALLPTGVLTEPRKARTSTATTKPAREPTQQLDAPQSVYPSTYTQASPQPTYTPPAVAPTPIATPNVAVIGCAENGSCYGDISAATGRAKTVHVDSYVKKDGTYVRGHYRSK